MSQQAPNSNLRILYVVRTNSMKYEARISRMFRFLSEKSCACEVYAIVKEKAGFRFDCKEYVAFADRISFFPLRILFKYFEVQFVTWRAIRLRGDEVDVVILANYEFLLVGLFLRLFERKRVIIDLHEHYYRRFFRQRWISRFLFTKVFNGVIFANRERARDFLGQNADCKKIAIARNMPDVPAAKVSTPTYTEGAKLLIAVVGGAIPGRFVNESIRALDHPDFSSSIEILTFGPVVGEPTNYITVTEHGPFDYWEVDGLLKGVDASLIFYDPSANSNNRLCEPNRFFQSFNLGHIIFTFYHSSLSEFYDSACKVIDRNSFFEDLRRNVMQEVHNKQNWIRDDATGFDRKVLTYESGLDNLELLARKN